MARVSRERAAGKLRGVWAGRDRGGYLHPSFQLLPSGSVDPRLSELLHALACRPGFDPAGDRFGWRRALWLYRPHEQLSELALALRGVVHEERPGGAAAWPDAARTPAEIFPNGPQAVVDLARCDDE